MSVTFMHRRHKTHSNNASVAVQEELEKLQSLSGDGKVVVPSFDALDKISPLRFPSLNNSGVTIPGAIQNHSPQNQTARSYVNMQDMKLNDPLKAAQMEALYGENALAAAAMSSGHQMGSGSEIEKLMAVTLHLLTKLLGVFLRLLGFKTDLGKNSMMQKSGVQTDKFAENHDAGAHDAGVEVSNDNTAPPASAAFLTASPETGFATPVSPAMSPAMSPGLAAAATLTSPGNAASSLNHLDINPHDSHDRIEEIVLLHGKSLPVVRPAAFKGKRFKVKAAKTADLTA